MHVGLSRACQARRPPVCRETSEATSLHPEAIRRLRMISPAREQCDFIGHLLIIDLYMYYRSSTSTITMQLYTVQYPGTIRSTMNSTRTALRVQLVLVRYYSTINSS